MALSSTGFKLLLIAEWEKNTGIAVKELRKALKRALTEGGKIIKKEATKNLRTKLPAAFKQGTKFSDKLSSGIINKVSKNATTAKVHIMGKGKKDSKSGTYRLRWFEKGTLLRKTQSGKNTGRIDPGKFQFFRTAVDSKLPLTKTTINSVLTLTLQKLNK